jgi:hypothetical protein
LPQPPPRNQSGEVLPHDHAEILADHGVIRRVSDKQVVKRADGRRTLSSLAFKPSGAGVNPGISIDLEEWIVAAGKNAADFVTTPRWVGSVRFTAGAVRAEGCRVGWDPIPRQGSLPANDFHGEVWDANKLRQRRLHDIAEWFVPIDGVDIR